MAAISNGTLAGLVPGIGLINAVSTAATAIDTFAKTTATANPTFDTDTTVGTTVTTGVKDGSVSKVEADNALSAAAGVRLAAIQAADKTITAETSTAQLIASKSDATTAAATFKTAALAAVGTSPVTGSAAAKVISDFDVALAAKAALVLTPEQALAASVAQAGAAAGVASSLTAASAVTTYAKLEAKVSGLSIKNITDLYDALKADVSTVDGTTGAVIVGGTGTATAAEHAALVAEVAKIPGYGAALVASAEKELAATKAATAVITTTAEVAKIDSDGSTGPLKEGKAYTDAAVTLANKTAALTAAEKGDVAVATAKAVVDQYTTLNKAASDASAAIVKFNSDNSTKFSITSLTGATDATAKQDVFYFPTKIAAANDFAIGGGSIAFGAGDSIVLGSGYTFNAGALTTGNATALEVFFVKGATGTQVVIETNAVGSATTVTDTAGTVTVSNDTAVINLVGVTADHLSFANGVVSYV